MPTDAPPVTLPAPVILPAPLLVGPDARPLTPGDVPQPMPVWYTPFTVPQS